MPKALRCSRCQHWLWMHLSASSVTHACLYYSMGRFVCCHQRGLSQTQRSSLITVKIVTWAWAWAKVWMTVRPGWAHVPRSADTLECRSARIICLNAGLPLANGSNFSVQARVWCSQMRCHCCEGIVCGDDGICLYVHDISDNLLLVSLKGSYYFLFSTFLTPTAFWKSQTNA